MPGDIFGRIPRPVLLILAVILAVLYLIVGLLSVVERRIQDARRGE